MLAEMWQWSVPLLVTSLFLEGSQIQLEEHLLELVYVLPVQVPPTWTAVG